ncbi:AAA family ATPase [Chondromyces apiculatus]|uniref:AAA family ATPase n=1 Tax=Chondromyces apiculatus TaxID=51 RepID=UPI0005C47941|nr:AAA family ATPase [Chondromyces apiculatus]
MRIDRLEIQNFKKFERAVLDLHPQFALLVGENGSGKTSILDALAVSLSVWLVYPPDAQVRSSGRQILKNEIRLEPLHKGDRIQFRECIPVVIRATGRIGEHDGVVWTRKLGETGKTTSKDAGQALEIIRDIYQRDGDGEDILCPILAYYGAGRAWLPSSERKKRDSTSGGPARRWAAFYDCFNERVRLPDLNQWFRRELTASASRQGRMRPGFEAVRRAVIRCTEGADDLWFDPDRDQIVLSIEGQPQPFDNLSAGQSMMLALVADIAIKAVTQNAHLLPPEELGPEDQALPRVLRDTPGVVLIDELDVHLHPRWQRRVATDLKSTFPAIQFICTTHSPQVIGEVRREEVRLLGADGITQPAVALGADSNWILEHVIGAASETELARHLQHEVQEAMDSDDLPAARGSLEKLADLLQGTTGELAELTTGLANASLISISNT